MGQFMLLLHDDATDDAELSAAEMQEIIARYRAWSQKWRESGHLTGGEKLTDDPGRIIRSGASGQGMIVSDGPYSETKDVIGGYFLIIADDYAAAETIARGCPHAERGKPIEIRQIQTMD
ncbi:MAG: hypothetical protein DHS20C03_18190 [Minwuia thermotolerans]|nr:MAG: hypothetical protein DHS20C03_18190 [Minwuia thermotolerans]